MESLLQDVRYAFRTLRRSPGFAAVAVLTLALGIGANTAIFSVVNAALLRPLPFEEAERLVRLYAVKGGLSAVSPPDYTDWRAQNRVFEDVAALNSDASYALAGVGGAEQVTGARATASFFSVLRARPVLGRSFSQEDEVPG
ncbi:MAG: ABC transporter permease, partial [Acidobacteria bacterium]|nr:ABC transporter permease [Acidobacteriota bacterium]